MGPPPPPERGWPWTAFVKIYFVYFIGIYGSPDSKSKHVRDILLKGLYLKNETIFIGDSEQDSIAAAECGIRFVQVANNHILIYMGNLYSRLDNLIINKM